MVLGRVEGCVLIFSYQSTKITTSCLPTIESKTLEPTKKDTLHPRTKEKPQQNCKVKSLSCVWLFATRWTVAYQAPLSMGFSRQEYWSGLLFPSPGGLPNPGIKPRSPTLEGDTLTSEPPGGTIIIKSNPIPTVWVTHKLENNNTKEVLAVLWRIWAPYQASQLRIWPRDRELPGNLTLKASGNWLQSFHGTGGNRDSWRTQTKSYVHQDPGERSSDPTGDGARTTCEYLRVSCRGVGWQ